MDRDGDSSSSQHLHEASHPQSERSHSSSQAVPLPQVADKQEEQTEQEKQNEQEVPYCVFSRSKRIQIVALVSLAATFSPLSSTIYFPAQDAIADSLHLTAETVNLSITTYLIAQGISPSIWGTLAEVYGRRQILLYTLVLYVGANVGLALVQNATMLLVFRMLQAAGSSSTISIGAGIIADITHPHERGAYLGYFSGARQISMAIAPVIGGVIAGSLSYRAIFWFLTIFAAFVIIMLLFLLPETARHIAGNGSVPLRSIKHRPLIDFVSFGHRKKSVAAEDEEGVTSVSSKPEGDPRTLSWWSFIEPLGYLFEKDVACCLFFGGAVYTAWSMVIATTTVLLQRNYHLHTIQVGLCFLANGVGCVLGSIFSGKALNVNYLREAQVWYYSTRQPFTKNLPGKGAPIPVDFPLENARLCDAPVYSAVCILSCIVYGWCLTPLHHDRQVNVSLVLPIITTFSLGFCATAVLNGNNTLMIDLVPGKSANGTAVNNLVRCLMGAVGVSLVDKLIRSIGAGWTGSVMAGLVTVGFVTVVIEQRFGRKWRGERIVKLAAKKAK